jgi:hypothetical protein
LSEPPPHAARPRANAAAAATAPTVRLLIIFGSTYQSLSLSLEM